MGLGEGSGKGLGHYGRLKSGNFCKKIFPCFILIKTKTKFFHFSLGGHHDHHHNHHGNVGFGGLPSYHDHHNHRRHSSGDRVIVVGGSHVPNYTPVYVPTHTRHSHGYV